MLLFIFQWTVFRNTYKQRLEFDGEATQETDFLLHTLKNSFWPIKKLRVQSQTETVTICPHTSRFLDLRFVSKLKLGHKHMAPYSQTCRLIDQCLSGKKKGSQWLD